jgi:hypothetical protein
MPPPNATAASLVPSADEVTDHQSLVGVLVPVQVMPEFVEVKMEKG